MGKVGRAVKKGRGRLCCAMAKPTRDERLATALRANLRRRKGQGQDTGAPEADAAPVEPTPPGDNGLSPSAPAAPRS
jgi:hypothetical protein